MIGFEHLYLMTLASDWTRAQPTAATVNCFTEYKWNEINEFNFLFQSSVIWTILQSFWQQICPDLYQWIKGPTFGKYLEACFRPKRQFCIIWQDCMIKQLKFTKIHRYGHLPLSSTLSHSISHTLSSFLVHSLPHKLSLSFFYSLSFSVFLLSDICRHLARLDWILDYLPFVTIFKGNYFRLCEGKLYRKIDAILAQDKALLKTTINHMLE